MCQSRYFPWAPYASRDLLAVTGNVINNLSSYLDSEKTISRKVGQ